MYQEEIRDRLVVMRAQEDNVYACPDYFQSRPQSQSQSQSQSQPKSAKSSISKASGPIDKICRFKMTQWCYTVIDYIKFERETVNIAMSYLDRFLASNCARAVQVGNSRKEYQLAAMTALFMAIKINEPVMIDMDLLTDLSKGLYTPSEFSAMETDILFGLNWRVNGPTAQSFLLHMLSLLQSSHANADVNMDMDMHVDMHDLFQLATHQIELSVQEHQFMTQKPSVIATASVLKVLQNSPHQSNTQLFTTSLLQLASSLDIPIDQILSTKESLSQYKTNSATMKMRPTTSSMIEVQMSQTQPINSESHSPRSAATVSPQSISSSSSSSSSHKNFTQDCSPICVSKRNLLQQQQQHQQ